MYHVMCYSTGQIVYHIMLCHSVSYHIVMYHIILYCSSLYHIIFFRYDSTIYHTLSLYQFILYAIVSIISYHALLHFIKLHYICYIISIISNYIIMRCEFDFTGMTLDSGAANIM